ncbi:TRAP transporter small permease subunit [Magnetospirillum sulfuroxidans]|uniref:TRAP transporter small permease protein n=1 Tax=Magnetospirillum sulfuroxidans TaxID=611300 RepID=A0ABS5I7Q2_9PROT|nr:TRAP transporter small permease subunit [Magnetospirillum sulfuroxidans]MBR9970339.1 TRAP transporter small permease subunit [Magnetospirillum sulfuroxidans]
MGALLTLAGVLDRVVERVGRASAWTNFVLVVVMASNVLLRYAFNTGAVWAQELEWHLMSPIILLGMSYAIQQEGHVRVDFIFARFPHGVKASIEIVTHLLVLAMAVILVLLSIGYVGQSFAVGEGSPDPGGLPFRWVLKAFIPLGFALLAIQSSAAALRAMVSLATGTPLQAEIAPHGQEEAI